MDWNKTGVADVGLAKTVVDTKMLSVHGNPQRGVLQTIAFSSFNK